MSKHLENSHKDMLGSFPPKGGTAWGELSKASEKKTAGRSTSGNTLPGANDTSHTVKSKAPGPIDVQKSLFKMADDFSLTKQF